jgi:hypothetical protein
MSSRTSAAIPENMTGSTRLTRLTLVIDPVSKLVGRERHVVRME